MDRDPNPIDPNSLTHTYDTLINLWTSGVRDYHSLLSDYLTANSIFTAAIGVVLARQPSTFLFTVLGIILCVFGILMVAADGDCARTIFCPNSAVGMATSR